MTSTCSLWLDGSAGRRYAPLAADIKVDVAILGGGLTGMTCALLLKQRGLRVAVLEAREIGCEVSGGTTAHITEMVDTRYHRIERDFGLEGARLVARSSRDAIEHIASWVSAYALHCGFVRVPAWQYAERQEQLASLEAEREAAARAGVSISKRAAPLPYPIQGSFCAENQAQFHPIHYLWPLANQVVGSGSGVYEETRAVAIDEGEPCRIYTQAGPIVLADQIVMATHSPLTEVFLQTKVANYRSYVVAFPFERELPPGLYWDMDDPYHYIRTSSVGGTNHLIVGGEDHKTGQLTATEQPHERLVAWTREHFALPESVAPSHRWSAQVVEPVDGLPFIGKSAGSERIWVATGYSGNGMTFSNIAARVIAEELLGQPSPYGDLYRATRFKPLASAESFLAENVDFPLHLFTDRLKPVEATSLDQVGPGEGKITRVGGQRLAVYREPGGNIHALSPVCTHMGCHVRFNAAERSWDCPCHGSRFDIDGNVLTGPAVTALRCHEVDAPKSRSPE